MLVPNELTISHLPPSSANPPGASSLDYRSILGFYADQPFFFFVLTQQYVPYVSPSAVLGCIAELSLEICVMFNIRLAGNEYLMAL
jgi:hypothetical protein